MSENKGKTIPSLSSAPAASALGAAAFRRLGVEVQGRVDDYLLRLDAAMSRRGALPAQRRAEGIEVRNFIIEKLTAKAGPGREVAHLPLAEVDAVLAEMGAPERRAQEAVPPPPLAPRYSGPTYLSKTALVGLLWAVLFPLMVFLSSIQLTLLPEESAPAWQSALQFTLLPLAWAAPFATTVMGLLALGQIQKAGGRLYGMSLALFDALLFPLLLLDVAVFYLCFKMAQQLVQQDAVSGPVAKLIMQVLPIVIVVLGDAFVAGKAWAAVRGSEQG